MDDIPLSWAFGALVAMLALSAFFSIAETAMMAINRYRLKHLVSEGHHGAIRIAEMLRHTDRLLGGILIGNTLAITVATTIASLITVRLFGEDKIAYFLSPIVVGFLVIVFSEITPKVIGATHPERAALLLSFPVKLALRALDLPGDAIRTPDDAVPDGGDIASRYRAGKGQRFCARREILSSRRHDPLGCGRARSDTLQSNARCHGHSRFAALDAW